MIKILAWVAGIAGALALSQFPEFSQQYLQRLSGAVDELRIVVENFDQAAQNSDKTRQEALDELAQTEFGADLGHSFSTSFERFERLSADLQSLKAANTLERLAQPWNMADPALLESTLAVYQPAVPVTREGLVAALVGFLVGWGGVNLGLGWFFRVMSARRIRRDA